MDINNIPKIRVNEVKQQNVLKSSETPKDTEVPVEEKGNPYRVLDKGYGLPFNLDIKKLTTNLATNNATKNTEIADLETLKKQFIEKLQEKAEGDYGINKKIFTKDMRKDYTILCPQMAPVHFELLETAVKSCGYNFELLRECTPKTVEVGLKYVNNDACYPSILVTGQMIEALQSGKYDINKLEPKNNIGIDGIRLCFHKKDRYSAFSFVNSDQDKIFELTGKLGKMLTGGNTLKILLPRNASIKKINNILTNIIENDIGFASIKIKGEDK